MSASEFAVEDIGSAVASRYLSDRQNFNRLIGQRDQEIADLKRKLAASETFQLDAIAYRTMANQRLTLADWLVDQSTPIRNLINAALGGEDFIPCTFTESVNGVKYRFNLKSTEYIVTQLDD